MKTYNQFINEGIRDKMKPVSEEFILKSLEGLSDSDKIKKIIKFNLNFDLLPGNLVVDGDLDCAENKSLTRLPDNLTVNGHLYAHNCGLTSLPDNLTVKNSLHLRNNKLTKLGKNLKVGGSISCAYNLKKIRLRKDTKIGTQFYN